jgi:hypothetical protein
MKTSTSFLVVLVLTNGDAVYVESGSDAGTRQTYNGSAWVQSDQSQLDEAGFIRAFVGKTGTGSETPSYSSQVYITDGETLETAIGALDAQVSTNATNIGTNDTDITNLQNDVGDNSSYTEQNHITNNETLAQSVDALDQAIQDLASQASASAITTATVVDSVLVDDDQMVKWLVKCSKNSDNSDRECVEILALNNGDTADATEVDWNEYGTLKVGNAIAGLDFSVTLTGTGASQNMNLSISSTDSVDVVVTRIPV